MTNEDKIRNFSKSELADFLANFKRLCPHPEYADIEAWLESEDERMLWKGTQIRYQGKSATHVDEKVVFGKLYNVVIQQDGVMVNIPI